jgi:alkylhydroperoxidase family enzyme
VLRSKFFSAEQVEAIVRDYRNAGLNPTEEALMAFAQKVLKKAYEIEQEDIDNLHEHGFSDEDILNIALTATSRSLYSRMVDAVGAQPPSEWFLKMEDLLGQDTYQALKVGRTFSNK